MLKYVGIGITSIMILGFLYLLYWWTNRTPDFEAVPLPVGTDPNNVLSLADSQAVRTMAIGLHNDMDGFTPFRDTDLWDEYLLMNDTLFVAVYNDFGALYYAEDGETLAEWVNGENFALTSSLFTPWSIYNGSELKNGLLDRFADLNLQ
ncbi:MAG: hypothetical protein GY881_02920 [Gammaproteobacteria bacterium]|nr:hypothetical protein [Gammaproteobacteria bacterium]